MTGKQDEAGGTKVRRAGNEFETRKRRGKRTRQKKKKGEKFERGPKWTFEDKL